MAPTTSTARTNCCLGVPSQADPHRQTTDDLDSMLLFRPQSAPVHGRTRERNQLVTNPVPRQRSRTPTPLSSDPAVKAAQTTVVMFRRHGDATGDVRLLSHSHGAERLRGYMKETIGSAPHTTRGHNVIYSAIVTYIAHTDINAFLSPYLRSNLLIQDRGRHKAPREICEEGRDNAQHRMELTNLLVIQQPRPVSISEEGDKMRSTEWN